MTMQEYTGSKSINESMGILGSNQKVVIPIPIITLTILVPMFGIFMLPFPWESHSIPIGFPYSCTSLVSTGVEWPVIASLKPWFHVKIKLF